MSTWVQRENVNFFQSFCITVVKTGQIPKHIAFIMDGNRRFANKHCSKSSVGHVRGFEKLAQTLRWCLDLGIPEVTVYAFSIENFKRTEDEVRCLLELAREKFEKLLEELPVMKEWGVRVHVAGRLSMLPKDIQTLAAKVMLETQAHNTLRLNIAFAYTGRDEISRVASYIVDGVKDKIIKPEDVTEDLVTQCMELSPPDLLIRTSGEVRLSDFMLWQISHTVLYFSNALWPEFTLWNLLAAILHFQRNIPKIKEIENLSETNERFLEVLEEKRKMQLWKYIHC